MKNSKKFGNNILKQKYLAVIIPVLWFCGCNSGSTAQSDVSPTTMANIVITNSLPPALTVKQESSFTVTATIIPKGGHPGPQTIVIESLMPQTEAVSYTPATCNISTAPNNESCKFTITIANPFPESYSLNLQNISSSTIPIVGQNINFRVIPPLRIFVTANTHNGRFSSIPDATSPFDGANKFCMMDSNNPDGINQGSWKALLFGNNSTLPNITYYRLDQVTMIAMANGGNLTGTSSSLLNSISESYAHNVWTGPTANTCENWQVSFFSAKGTTGAPVVASYKWATNDNQQSCANNKGLYCVEQPPQ